MAEPHIHMPRPLDDTPAGRPLVITHGNCPDGWCCELLFRRHFGETADYTQAKYGDPIPDVTGRPRVIVADFSWPEFELRKMQGRLQHGWLTVIDHHKSAKTVLVDTIKYQDETWCPSAIQPIEVVFDLNHSGAYLTWKYLKDAGATDPIFADGNPPLVVQYTEDRDLWLWRLPGSKEINAALASYPKVLEVWNGLHDQLATQDGYWDLFRQGAAILRAQSQAVEAAVAQAVEMTICGHPVLVVNTTCHHSEIGERLAEGRPFGATYYDDHKRGLRVWSLRSREGGIDVSEVAKQFGGGGHRQAAGFQTALTADTFVLPARPDDQYTLACC